MDIDLYRKIVHSTTEQNTSVLDWQSDIRSIWSVEQAKELVDHIYRNTKNLNSEIGNVVFASTGTFSLIRIDHRFNHYPEKPKYPPLNPRPDKMIKFMGSLSGEHPVMVFIDYTWVSRKEYYLIGNSKKDVSPIEPENWRKVIISNLR